MRLRDSNAWRMASAEPDQPNPFAPRWARRLAVIVGWYWGKLR